MKLTPAVKHKTAALPVWTARQIDNIQACSEHSRKHNMATAISHNSQHITTTNKLHGLWNPKAQYRKGSEIIRIQGRNHPISQTDAYFFKIHRILSSHLRLGFS